MIFTFMLNVNSKVVESQDERAVQFVMGKVQMNGNLQISYFTVVVALNQCSTESRGLSAVTRRGLG